MTAAPFNRGDGEPTAAPLTRGDPEDGGGDGRGSGGTAFLLRGGFLGVRVWGEEVTKKPSEKTDEKKIVFDGTKIDRRKLSTALLRVEIG